MCHEPFKLITGINLGWGEKRGKAGKSGKAAGEKPPRWLQKNDASKP